MPERERCFSMGWAILSGPVAVDEERLGAATRNSTREKGKAKGRVRLLRACGSAELGKMVSGSATQSLWLGDRKVGSQVIGKHPSRLPARGTVGKVRRGGRRASDSTKERVYRFRVRLGRERRASRLPCPRFGLGDDRRSTSGSGDVSLTILIASVSCSKSLASLTNRFFHFSKPPGFRMAYDGAERNGRLGRIRCQRSQSTW